MREEQLKTYAKVSCPCGNTVRIDPMSAQRSFRCPVCTHLISFVVTIDKATKRPKVSIVVTPDAIRQEVGDSLGVSSRTPPAPPEPPPEEEPPAPRPRPATRGVFGACICGAEFPVDEEELTTIQACPRCDVKYHVVVKMDRETKVRSAILVPVDAKPQRSRAMPVQKAPKTIKKARMTSAPARKAPKPPPTIPPGAQAVVCTCGQVLVVRRKDVETGLTCDNCGKALRLMEDRNPQTLAPRIRLRPEPKK
ncbi:MAG TPA: hypothetical protein VF950_03355 [Planctomycetota bacterium]